MEELTQEELERQMVERTNAVNAKIEAFNNSAQDDAALQNRIRRLQEVGFDPYQTQPKEEPKPKPEVQSKPEELTEEFLNQFRADDIKKVMDEPEPDSTALLKDYLSDISPVLPKEDIKETFVRDEDAPEETVSGKESAVKENEEPAVEENSETVDDVNDVLEEPEDLPVEDDAPSFEETLADPSKKELILQLADSLITVGETLKKLVD